MALAPRTSCDLPLLTVQNLVTSKGAVMHKMLLRFIPNGRLSDRRPSNGSGVGFCRLQKPLQLIKVTAHASGTTAEGVAKAPDIEASRLETESY